MNADRPTEIALALLRAALLVVILISEQLVDARQLGHGGFFAVLAIGGCYALAGVAVATCGWRGRSARAFQRGQPALDVLFLTALAYTSGGAFSDSRRAFFVIPLAAAFSERPRSAAGWSLLAVVGYSAQAAIAGGHPIGALNTWQRTTLNQDLYLAWTGTAATLMALALRRRSGEINDLARSRQRLVAQAIAAIERERTRLAGALHDSPVQNLIAARHDLRRAERTGDPESFGRLHAALDSTIQELRDEIFHLHPHVLDHVGLGAALEQVARRDVGDSQVEVKIAIDPEAELADRKFLFALGRELLGNALRHASASQISLSLTRERDLVTLRVRDDGCGIEAGRTRQALLQGHIGLAAVRERVAALNGTLEIETAPGAGCDVRVSLPVRTPDRVTPTGVARVSPQPA
ncbi:MAG TPA: ATP-binding protein [Solirubrobacteraceae bacterium]|nr:ATP-binding protein [Solirubrobacteraceae bacterium]